MKVLLAIAAILACIIAAYGQLATAGSTGYGTGYGTGYNNGYNSGYGIGSGGTGYYPGQRRCYISDAGQVNYVACESVYQYAVEHNCRVDDSDYYQVYAWDCTHQYCYKK